MGPRLVAQRLQSRRNGGMRSDSRYEPVPNARRLCPMGRFDWGHLKWFVQRVQCARFENARLGHAWPAGHLRCLALGHTN